MKRLGQPVTLIAACGVVFLFIGMLLSQSDWIPLQMPYGNFDVAGLRSFVNRLAPGVFDHASLKLYTFDQWHWHPLIVMLGVIFPVFLIAGLWRNEEFWRWGSSRPLVQWVTFVTARLGIIRVSGAWPLKRSCLGTFPFLNCQACEMASGACPIGVLQHHLKWGVWPFSLLGSMLLFGVVLGKSICGWLCPFGFFSDLMDRLSLRLVKIPRVLGYLRYWVLALVFIGTFLYLQFGIIDRNFFCSTLCGSGKIYGLIPYWASTASGSFLPVSGWIPDLMGVGMTLGCQVLLTLLLLVAMLLVSGRVFCRVLCPLGGFWGLFYPVSLVGIRHDSRSCSGCGACERTCPMGVSQRFEGFLDQSSCMSCGRCVKVCLSGSRRYRQELGLSLGNVEVSMPEQKPDFHYGSLYNRIRKDIYVAAITLLSRTPMATARYAWEQTDFYRKLYGDQLPDQFDELPLTLKSEIGACDPYDVLAREMTDQVVYYGETTGSTGKPTPSFYTMREFHAARILSRITPYIGALDQVLAENRAVVNGLTFGFTIAGMSFGDFLQANGGMVANIGTRSTIAPPERMVRALKRLRPSVITGTEIDLLCWLKILQEDYPQDAERVREHLKVAMSTAELCSVSRSRAIEREFGLVHVDIYACVEGFFSVPCPCGEKHILPLYHTEVLDPELKHATEYGEGRFAFTNLIKKSSPLVRYLLDDYVTISISQCPHGFKKSIVPHGRWELTVQVGGRRCGVRHFEEAIFKHGLFGDYRVVLEDGRMNVTVETFGRHEPAKTIEEALGAEFGMTTVVELVPFGTITAYREVRKSKPILKIEDRRSCSTQKIPEYL
ncbi:MAG TPA: 4Fe-4S binding protein [Candidatus Ozemobacteraceae bacterium]|nr:4Fe-4S binding protein [Candidatus Ozemobacteraceae bacterium]